MKKYFLLALSAAVWAFTGCSDDDTPNRVTDPSESYGSDLVYVLNQGSYYSGIDGTLDQLCTTDSTYLSSVFRGVNGQSLGDSPQAGVVYGSRLYVAMYGSNLVWAINRTTLKVEGMIKTNEPESICAAEGAVYVSNNDGFVSRIDTTTLEVTDKIAVGPNPSKMVAVGPYVYVSISDGYNYANGYVNGYKVAKIDAATCSKVADITVGMNPGPICADRQGNVFVVAQGNYEDVAPTVWKIQPDDLASVFCAGSGVAAYGSRLYVLNNYTDWSANPPVSTLSYAAYDIQTGNCLTDQLLEGQPLPEAPTFIAVHPVSGEVYVGSSAAAYDYTSPGYLYRYTSEGKFIAKYNAGVAPCAVVF